MLNRSTIQQCSTVQLKGFKNGFLTVFLASEKIECVKPTRSVACDIHRTMSFMLSHFFEVPELAASIFVRKKNIF